MYIRPNCFCYIEGCFCFFFKGIFLPRGLSSEAYYVRSLLLLLDQWIFEFAYLVHEVSYRNLALLYPADGQHCSLLAWRERAGPSLLSFQEVPPTLSRATGVTLLSLAHSPLFFIVQNCVVSFHPLLWLLEEQDPSCKSAPTCTISGFFRVKFSKVSEPGLGCGFLDHVSWMSSLTLPLFWV